MAEKADQNKSWIPQYIPPGESDINYIDYILEALYESQGLGFPDDPLNNLVFQLIMRKTSINMAKEIYNKLYSTTDGEWGNYFKINEQKAGKVFLGFYDLYPYIRTVLTVIYNTTGALTFPDFNNYQGWFEFLKKLPGVGPVTAKMVILYSLDYEVFPANQFSIQFLNRVGFMPPLVLNNYRQIPEWLENKIPPRIKKRLHRNIIAHCNDICAPENHDCLRCPVGYFCNRARKSWQDEWEHKRDVPSFIDLFCGAGGSSAGFRKATYKGQNFRVAAAADSEAWSVKSFWLNHPELPSDRVLQCDLQKKENIDKLKKLTGEDNVILVVGGPPCQDFSLIGWKGRTSTKSVAGKRFIDMPASRNYSAFVDAIFNLEPIFFVMENVTGILAANGGDAGNEIKEDFKEKYECDYLILDAAMFGVPQSRVRTFFFGVKKNSKNDKLARQALDEIKTILENIKEKRVTLRQAISDLPPLESGEGKEFIPVKYRPGRPSKFKEKHRNNKGLLFNHVARPNNARDLELYKLLAPGEKAKDVADKYNRHELMIYRNDIFKDKYKKLEWNNVSSTIVAHLQKDGHMFIHPEQVRSITVREAARIQSFSDSYIFAGPRTYQYRQVGNAIPPLMARKIGETILYIYYRFYAKREETGEEDVNEYG